MKRTCETCERQGCMMRSPTVVYCCKHKLNPQTNADRIRAMSDEELADALMRFVKGLVESEGRVVAFEEGFREELLHQLQQPVKEDKNDA